MNKRLATIFISVFLSSNLSTLATSAVYDVENIVPGIASKTTNLLNRAKKERYKTLSTVNDFRAS